MTIRFWPTIWSDATVLEKDGGYALIDTGADWQEEMIRKYLDSLAVKNVDFILITHFHPDHYGCLEMIVRENDVKKVYFKQYSGVTATDGTGAECGDESRREELKRCAEIKSVCGTYSDVVEVENVSEIDFRGTKFHLFNSQNTVKTVFEDTEGSCAGKYVCNENQNSLMAYFEVSGRTVLISGDITDFDMPHPLISRMNTRFSKEIGRHVDIYKAPHHGYGAGSAEALAVYTPTYVFITNSEETVTENTVTVQLIRKASPDADISFAADGGALFTVTDNGTLEKETFSL